MKKPLWFLATAVVAVAGWYLLSPLFRGSEPVPEAPSSPVGMAATRSEANPFSSEARAATGVAQASQDEAAELTAARPSQASGVAFEQSLLTKGMVNDRAMKSLEAKNFDQVVNALDGQNAGRRNDLAGKYRAEIEETLAAFGPRSRLDRFACGSNVCMASFRSPASDKSFFDWYENLQNTSLLNFGAMAQYQVQLPDGVREHRILFTTLPGTAGFVVGGRLKNAAF